MKEDLLNEIDIPIDVYDSDEESVFVIPIWWVNKQSLEIYLEKNFLTVYWERINPKIKETLKIIKSECFWWKFSKRIELPHNIYFDKISIQIDENNILTVIIPKILIPEKIKLKIDYI